MDTYSIAVDIISLGYTYGRIVYSLHKAVGAKFKQLLYVHSSAAATVQHVCIVILF